MATARDLCRKILEATGTVGLRQPIEGAQLQDTLEYLNMELTFLNNQNAFKPFEKVFEETIPSGQSEYTIGVGGDIELPRPISISWMKILVDTRWIPMEQATQKTFSKFSTSTNTTTYPLNFYYESTYPLGTIGFAYELSESRQYKIAIRHVIPPFGLNDEVDLPEGYYPLLLWGTASRIPDIPSIKRAEAKDNYDEMLSTIKSQNTKAPVVKSNYRRTSRYNKDTDANEYRGGR